MSEEQFYQQAEVILKNYVKEKTGFDVDEHLGKINRLAKKLNEGYEEVDWSKPISFKLPPRNKND